LSGELSVRSAGTVCGAVTEALLEADRVLIDVSGLRLTWTPAVQVFPSTLAVLGGWPCARLVLLALALSWPRHCVSSRACSAVERALV
jgi:hypothetical protein